jgi:SulP family sulfate permease
MFARLFPDLAQYKPAWIQVDLASALAITFMAVPQGIAYAMIAGLPPATGLFAGAIPTILGSIFRSSNHVVTGPTNALSLLVGTAVAASATDDPMTAGLILATMVGVFQLSAGLLKLGAIVDYISTAVVAGYITGAGILIGVGQLKNLTGTTGSRGDVYSQISAWIAGLGDVNYWSVGIGVGTAVAILGMRAVSRRIPTAIVVLAIGVVLSWAIGLDQYGVALARDIAPVPIGLPPLTIPGVESVAQLSALLPVAVAATVLSLVESSAVARSIASRTGQRLSSNREFIGQGVANLAAGFFGGYPTSGSLSRSALNERAGAKSRLGGVFAGIMMILVLLFLGPIVDLTPIPSLAGLLLVVAVDLVDVKKIRAILSGDVGDKVAFLATLVGTWVLSLDQAIYLGVGLSLMLFLQKARNLVVKEMVLDEKGRFTEITQDGSHKADVIRVLHIEGSLFFGAANELRDAIDDVLAHDAVKVLIIRLKRTRGLDYTTATVLEAAHQRMVQQGRHLYLVGLRPDTLKLLERVGVADALGRDHLYPTRPGLFLAMDNALRDAVEIVGEEACSEALTTYLRQRSAVG